MEVDEIVYAAEPGNRDTYATDASLATKNSAPFSSLIEIVGKVKKVRRSDGLSEATAKALLRLPT